MIINPLFEFFDGISWSSDELYLVIFMKIIENSRQSKNLEHFEIFLIEKIIDYLTAIEKNKNLANSFHGDPTDNKNIIIPQKSLKQKKDIKEKVYYLLKKVINHISYIYLSFLYIDVMFFFFFKIIFLLEISCIFLSNN